MSDSAIERVHPPSPQRRELARAEGRAARSHELSTSLVLLAGLGTLWYFGGDLAAAFGNFAQQQWGGRPALAITESQAVDLWRQTAAGFARVLLPLLGMMMLIGVISHLGQIGLRFLPQKVAPDWNRISPARGIERLVSGDNFVRLALMLIRLAIVALVGGASLWADRQRLAAIGAMQLGPMAAAMAEITLWTCLKVAGAMLALGVIDYLYQRWRFEQSLKLTDQELREEVRAREGDPALRSRRVALRRQMRLERLARATAEAVCVITGRGGLAIALRYDAQTMAAPEVWAKGTGDQAQAICRAAKEHGVSMLDRPELARQLNLFVPTRSPIPESLYRSVAVVIRQSSKSNRSQF